MSIDFKYRELLLEISQEILPTELEEMKFLCVGIIPEAHLEDAHSTLRFFRDLERQNKLRIDDLELLIYTLERIKRQDLVLKLRSFQLFRQTYFERLCRRDVARFGTGCNTDYNNIKRECLSSNDISPSASYEDRSSCRAEPGAGEITVRCILKLASVGAWFAGSAYILNKHREDPEVLVNLVTKAILPSGIAIGYIVGGSVKLVLWATDLNGLRELWNRYNSGELHKNLERILFTEDLVRLANGEKIQLDVEMSENEYRNVCLDLLAAYQGAQRKVSTCLLKKPRRSSLPDLTSLNEIQPCPTYLPNQEPSSRKVMLGATTAFFKVKRLAEMRGNSSASSEHDSASSSCEIDDRQVLLSDFLQTSDKVQDVCSILDREMILCHDWRSVASEFSYKMKDICLLERNKSPSLALLGSIALKAPDTRLSELIDKLSYLERDDVVDLIESGNEENSDPQSLANLPFIVRKKIALELDHATMSQFTDVVHNLASSVSSGEITALQRRPSPTMALLEELETVFPSLHVSHLRNACSDGKVDAVVSILNEYQKALFKQGKMQLKTARRVESLKKLKQIGSGDSGVSLGSPLSPK